MENKTLEMTMLFDFFGELLSEKQREYFDLYYNEDLSLAEIAESAGISRQGVRDIIVRAENVLRETEEKTGVVRHFTEVQEVIHSLEEDASKLLELLPDGMACDIAATMLRRLQELKG